MKEVSETLEDAQIAATRTPYIHLLFTSYDGLTTYDLSSDGTYGDRIVLIDHFEEPYNDYATVVLRNYDGTLPTDLRGYWVEIGYGDFTGTINEYSATPRLWVKMHQLISAGGKYLTVLSLEGMWAKMKETLLRMGDPPYYTAGSDEGLVGTVYDLIAITLAEIDPAFTLAALVQDDGIIDSYSPPFTINSAQFDDAASAIYTLLKMTASFLRSKSGLDLEVRYLLDTDEIDMTYETDMFYEFTGGKVLAVPNQILVFANAGTDLMWTSIISAESSDTESQEQYGIVPDIATAPEITTQGDANARATAIRVRQKQEVQAGRLIIPHNCMHELYDYIEVSDSRL